MDVEGLEISPPPADKYEYFFYKSKLDVFKKHPNNNRGYTNIVTELYL